MMAASQPKILEPNSSQSKVSLIIEFHYMKSRAFQNQQHPNFNQLVGKVGTEKHNTVAFH